MNNSHPNIKFTMETEHNETLPFLDILVIRQSDGTLTTQVYRKATYTVLYLRWDRFVPKQYKIGLVKCLIHRAWHICSRVEYFRQEMDFVKSVLVKNVYPQNFINSLFTKFLQSKYTDDIKYPVFGPQKKPIYISLPYCGLQSQKLARQLKRIYSKIAPWTNLICFLNLLRNLFSQQIKITLQVTISEWCSIQNQLLGLP